jgi:hypothetical protein
MNQKNTKPHLFGIENSNRNFDSSQAWGKNQFNSAFPASLCCYLDSKGISANFIKLENEQTTVGEIEIESAFGCSPKNKNIFFSFEDTFKPYEKYSVGQLPRVDLVIKNLEDGRDYSGIEIKLTALPDNSTCQLSEEKYGSEIVVRPDTIVYLACSLARNLDSQLKQLLSNKIVISDWTDQNEVIPFIPIILSLIKKICIKAEQNQKAFLLQPIWKTQGKSPNLSNNCLDIFFWSDSAFGMFISESGIVNQDKINRQTRTSIWLYKMLLEISEKGKFDHKKIIDTMTYDTKNDKAFASSGTVTHKYMNSKRLVKPIIEKNEITNIILNNGELLLSPERRFDSIIFNTPNLF